MKVCTVIGARPQFIKAAAVSRAFAALGDVRECVIHTGQHYDYQMSDVFFDELGMAPPAHSLGIGSGSHGAQTGRMLAEIERVLLEEVPDWLLVYGDTNSTLAGALAASKLTIPIAHVEAGLRSFNRAMPEEINRIATDAVSTHLFTPTDSATAQLLTEGHSEATVTQCGDVMYDIFLANLPRARKESEALETASVQAGSYALATVHRAENTDDDHRLRTIFEALATVNQTQPVVCPLHPRTRAGLERIGLLNELRDTINFIPPVGYLDMLALLDGCSSVMTDSGGVQKEAFFSQKPCYTLRGETEWTELVDAGWNVLALPDDAVSLATVLGSRDGFAMQPVSPYGKGDASRLIAETLVGL